MAFARQRSLVIGFSTQRKHAATVAALAVYTSGVIVRCFYIFKWHRAMDYVYSDMEMYLRAATDFCNPRFVSSINETVHPPGARFLFGTLRWLEQVLWPNYEPSMTLVPVAQFVLSILVPLLLAGTAWELFGRRTALFMLVLASLYFPFFDYAGYLLSEGPFLFALVCSFFLLVRSLRTTGQAAIWYGAGAGVMLGCAAALKTVALPAALLVLLALGAMGWKYRLPLVRPLVAAVAGLLLILIPLAVRGPRLSGGRFCLIANDASRNILLGHYGRIRGIKFTDPARRSNIVFISPATHPKGYQHVVDVPAGAYESAKLIDLALRWVREHPGEALMLSFEHMFDLAFGTLPWPSSENPRLRNYVDLFHYLFLIFVLLPVATHVCHHLRPLLRLEPELCADLLVLAPVLALAVVAFLSLGEPRYRVPFDGFLLLLAARYYCGAGSARWPTRVS